MVGTLRPELVARLEQDHGARALDGLSPAEAASARVAVTSGVWGVRAEHLDRLPELGAIVNFGVGYDSTDVDEATRRGVVVSNTPDVLTDCVADTAVGLVIDTMRGLSAADRFVRRGEWADGRTPPLARRVTGARVGIVGLGRIGLAIAARLEGFGTSISYHNRTPRTDVSYAYVADVVALAAGATSSCSLRREVPARATSSTPRCSMHSDRTASWSTSPAAPWSTRPHWSRPWSRAR